MCLGRRGLVGVEGGEDARRERVGVVLDLGKVQRGSAGGWSDRRRRGGGGGSLHGGRFLGLECGLECGNLGINHGIEYGGLGLLFGLGLLGAGVVVRGFSVGDTRVLLLAPLLGLLSRRRLVGGSLLLLRHLLLLLLLLLLRLLFLFLLLGRHESTERVDFLRLVALVLMACRRPRGGRSTW